MTNNTTIAEQNTEQGDAKRQRQEKENLRLRRDQALGSAIQYHIRDVIKVAAKTVRRLKPANGRDSEMRENQLRNVVNASISAASVEEVAAFIFYQMGRSKHSRQWLYGDFGDQVVKDLLEEEEGKESVKKAAKEAEKKALELIGDTYAKRAQSDKTVPESEKLFEEAHLALARQYLGYLNRMFYFASRSDDDGRWDDLVILAEEEAR